MKDTIMKKGILDTKRPGRNYEQVQMCLSNPLMASLTCSSLVLLLTISPSPTNGFGPSFTTYPTASLKPRQRQVDRKGHFIETNVNTPNLSHKSSTAPLLLSSESGRTRGGLFSSSLSPSRVPFSSTLSTTTTTTTLWASSPSNDVEEGSKVQGETPESQLDSLLDGRDLRGAIRFLRTNPTVGLTRRRFREIFDAIEVRTGEAEENNLNTRFVDMESMDYPLTSPARTEMTDMYKTLRDLGHLRLFGAASEDQYPAAGSKIVTPTLLETVTGLSMVSLTPKPTNTLLIAGVILAVAEGFFSLATGVDLNFLIIATLFVTFLDRLLVNGALFETAMKWLMPEVNKKILRHEAGHFLCAYLLGCPVEGCVLSAWAALRDSRFGGRRTNVSAGTSFFDPELSEQINGKKPLSRSSIDRYTVVVMAGIAAEAINFGRADGGAGDEMSLVQFLTRINPRSGGAVAWNPETIKNQARWGAMQAVLLLRHYKEAYEALVDALERGGSLADCVYAIENAARDKGLGPLSEPVGYVVDRGLYGEWTTTPPKSTEVTADQMNAEVVGGMSSNSQIANSDVPGSDVESSEEILKEYRRVLEGKLKELNQRLGDIDSDGGVTN